MSLPARLLREPALLELGKRLWGLGGVQCASGLPRLFSGDELKNWLRPDDVVCELRAVPQDGRSFVWLLLPSSDGARWVDRILGGDGAIAHAPGLSEPEYGVLAYALGRSLNASLPNYQLTQIEPARTASIAERCATALAWPLALDTPLGRVDVRLLMSEQVVAASPVSGAFEVLLSDLFEGELSSASCAPGDVLLSDRLALTCTSAGLVGPVEVKVEGLAETYSATLSGHTLRLNPAAKPGARAGRVELVIARQRLSLEELGRLGRGDALPLTDVPLENVQVFQDGVLRAEGGLVVHRGALGVRLSRLR